MLNDEQFVADVTREVVARLRQQLVHPTATSARAEPGKQGEGEEVEGRPVLHGSSPGERLILRPVPCLSRSVSRDGAVRGGDHPVSPPRVTPA